MRDLVAPSQVEDDIQGFGVGHPAGRVLGETLRLVHPGVGGDDREGAADPGDHHRDSRPEVGPAAEALPAVYVDGEEDRLGEEEDPLDRERDPEGVGVALHEPRPEQAELEAQHGACDRSTAKVTAIALVQRRARRIASPSSRLRATQFAIRMIAGNATPMQARTMWNPTAHFRADQGRGRGMSRGRRYRANVERSRRRIEREERQARGERTSAEVAADEILQRILPDGHRAKRRSQGP